MVIRLNRRQARIFFGETWDIYQRTTKSLKMEQVVEDLSDGTRLLWIGQKRTDRVIYYLHGGAFIFGVIESAPKLFAYMQENLEKRGKPTGVTMLNYTLVPDATFPIQLRQAVVGIQHLINIGVGPENIQLMGDSAGAVIIHQVLSHILHPVEGVPKLTLSAPFAGAYMMSPWATMLDDKILHTNAGRGDMLDPTAGVYWASKVLDNVPPSARPYVEANSAPEEWLVDVNKIVDRILISCGDLEILRDSIIKYSQTVQSHHPKAQFFLDEYGIHIDPFVCFYVGEPNRGKLIPFILEWLDQGFSKN
ncbi:Alpha/Beta hydrolase protein, partial [Gymnopilus junonius]